MIVVVDGDYICALCYGSIKCLIKSDFIEVFFLKFGC